MIPFDLQPHEILGVRKGASKEEAQNAFKLLARAIHPDMVPSNQAGATALFKLINFALEGIKSGGTWPANPVPEVRITDPQLFGWNQNAKGNWTIHKAGLRITVYFKNKVWKWISNPEAYDEPMFSKTAFMNEREAIENAMDILRLWEKKF